MSETYKQQMKDSETIFTAISSGNFDNFQQAQQAVIMGYVPDMSFSRAGISHALKRLENLFYNRRTASQWYLYEEDHCPICDRVYNKSITRQYTEKPKNHKDRHLQYERYDHCEE